MSQVYLHLEVISAEKILHAGDVKSVSAPGIWGDLTVYYQHAPLLSLLKPGHISFLTPDDCEHLLFVSGGMLEVQPTAVTILADTVIRAEDLDEKSALAARASARQQLTQAKEGMTYQQALSELANASAQIEILSRLRKLKRRP